MSIEHKIVREWISGCFRLSLYERPAFWIFKGPWTYVTLENDTPEGRRRLEVRIAQRFEFNKCIAKYINGEQVI